MGFTDRMWSVVAAVVVVLAVAGVIGYAQSFRTEPVTPTVLSGSDVGFRVEGDRAGTPVGKLVVRINGQWVEADFSSGVRPLTSR